MNLIDLINRAENPQPWTEGEKIPWNEPGFSKRMLEEHLSQKHDAASRRFDIIDKQVAWIHDAVLSGRQTKILDLGCGPGLYTRRFAKLGHECTGIDFSPASIDYAVKNACSNNLTINYIFRDLRSADFGEGYGLVMLIFGEFNTFRPGEARLILTKANHALAKGGTLLLEPHTYAAVRSIGKQSSTWYSSKGGLFFDKPHLYLTEYFWDEQHNAATERYFIIDPAIGEVMPYAESMQAYTDEQYQGLLEECGFEKVTFFPSLTGDIQPYSIELMAVVAKKSDKG